MMDDNRDDSRYRGYVPDDHIHGKAFLFVVAVIVALVPLGLRVAPKYIEYFKREWIPHQILADFTVQKIPHQTMADPRDGVTINPVRPVLAQEAAECLERAAQAARSLNYSGTLLYQHFGRTETLRVLHLADSSGEHEKLVSVEGPAREVVRDNEQIRVYYPDAKVIRLDSRNTRNAFPSLLPQQRDTLVHYYNFNPAETERIAGLEAQAYIFQSKDGLRYGHKLWADVATGLLVKEQLLDERGFPLEQFQFIDIKIGARIDRDMVSPSWPPAPPAWQVQTGPCEADAAETGWVVRGAPPGFSRVAECYRTARGKRAPVAHIVYSDGLVAVSVFIEPASSVHPAGLLQQGGVNVFIRDVDGYVVTALGEAPAATLRQIAYSVAHR